jgi:putative MATE family efflux protein
MRDLTQGSITAHLLSMAAFIGASLVFQTLYFLIDLYFVSRLGNAAIAGVSAAGTIAFLIMGATQLVGVGAMSLAAQAVGRKDDADANLVVNQAMSLSLLLSTLTLMLGYSFADAALGGIAADAETATAARAYFHAFLPALALMFPGAALGAALRATGVVQAPMLVQTLALALNALFAPLLIAGWGTGFALGVTGAGLASTIASLIGFSALLILFPRTQTLARLKPRSLAPKLKVWTRIVAIGLPSSGEVLLMFPVMALIYWLIRDFGPHAQAGFGVGSRIMQSILMPAMAVALAAAPIAGQNFGAGRFDRVRETFWRAALIGSTIMLFLSMICQLRPEILIRLFTDDPAASAVAATYLRISSWNFVGVGLVFACSSMFQGLGDTRPSLVSSALRLVTFAIPAIWLSQRTDASLESIWWASVASIALQALTSLVLLQLQFRKALGRPHWKEPARPDTAAQAQR